MSDDKIAEIRARHAQSEKNYIELEATWKAQVHEDRAALLAEVERLREALHRVSLASQNSMSSKDECGRIAREALEAKP